MQSAKIIIKSGLSILIGTSLGWIVLPDFLNSSFQNADVALAQQRYPQADEKGDYYIVNANGSYSLPYEWEVVDPDPNGLNCRLFDRNAPGGPDIYNYPVSFTVKQGERLSSSAISLDDRGLPWLRIGSSFSRENCFVRANTSYVRPVRPIPRF